MAPSRTNPSHIIKYKRSHARTQAARYTLNRPPSPSFPAQVHPTSLVDPKDPTNLSKFLAPESMRGSGGILLNAEGKRFANELTTRSVLTEAIFAAGTPMPGPGKEEGEEGGGGGGAVEEGVAPTVAYLVLNGEAAEAFGTGVLGFYASECCMYGLARSQKSGTRREREGGGKLKIVYSG